MKATRQCMRRRWRPRRSLAMSRPAMARSTLPQWVAASLTYQLSLLSHHRWKDIRSFYLRIPFGHWRRH